MISRQQQGFSLVSAIFLIVVVALLGTFMVTIGTTQQQTATFSVMGSRALAAADSGLQWAIRRAVRDGAAGLNCSAPPAAAGQINFTINNGWNSGFAVRVGCRVQTFTEAADTYNVYNLESEASLGAAGTADYFRRTIRASVTTAP